MPWVPIYSIKRFSSIQLAVSAFLTFCGSLASLPALLTSHKTHKPSPPPFPPPQKTLIPLQFRHGRSL